MTSDARFQPYVLAARQSDSPTPLYHQLYSILKSMIVEDVLSYGERVPTEALADCSRCQDYLEARAGRTCCRGLCRAS